MNTYAYLSYWKGFNSEYTSHDLDEYHQSIISELNEILPHGSGINYDWHYTIQKNGLINAHNSFDAMDEYGGYCHIYDFSVKIKPIVNNPNFIVAKVDDPVSFEFISLSFKGQQEYICCGYGLKDYLIECFYMLD